MGGCFWISFYVFLTFSHIYKVESFDTLVGAIIRIEIYLKSKTNKKNQKILLPKALHFVTSSSVVDFVYNQTYTFGIYYIYYVRFTGFKPSCVILKNGQIYFKNFAVFKVFKVCLAIRQIMHERAKIFTLVLNQNISYWLFMSRRSLLSEGKHTLPEPFKI